MVMLEKNFMGFMVRYKFSQQTSCLKIHSPRTGLLKFICLARIFRVFEPVINTQQYDNDGKN